MINYLGFEFSLSIVNCVVGCVEDCCVLLFARLLCLYSKSRLNRFIFLQLLNLCEAEDSALTKLPCYKSLPSLVPLRIAALSKLM